MDLRFSPSRRRFLFLAAGSLGAGAFSRAAESLPSHSRRSRALGTEVAFTVLHSDAEVARGAIDAALAEIDLIEQAMSLYRPESQISRLNRTGRYDSPDPRFVEVLRCAAETSKLSGGAFDITVQPLWKLHDAASKEGRVPGAAEIEAARALVDWSRVRIDDGDGTIYLDGVADGAAITLNGIAQGFAADAALRELRRHGIRHALIDTGELGAVGKNAGGIPWRAGVQHPRQADAFATVAPLDGRCLATSGDYETTFSDDFSRHHVFDPRSGLSPAELASVSVLAPTAMQADALSTALMVTGAEAGAELLTRVTGVEALFILKNGRRLATTGFPNASL